MVARVVYGGTAALSPPLPWWSPLAWFLVVAATLASLVVGGVGPPGPLDDAEPADQRNGLLIDEDAAVAVPELRLPGDVVGKQPVVVVFDRAHPDPERFAEWRRAVPDGVAVVLALPEDAAGVKVADVPVVGNAEELADRLGLAEPSGGGFPVGYVVLDSEARVRHATLDPTYLDHPFEITTVAGAVA
jgi:hypothetical protein